MERTLVTAVMAGLVPAIHVLLSGRPPCSSRPRESGDKRLNPPDGLRSSKKQVKDARDKPRA